LSEREQFLPALLRTGLSPTSENPHSAVKSEFFPNLDTLDALIKSIDVRSMAQEAQLSLSKRCLGHTIELMQETTSMAYPIALWVGNINPAALAS
jgi:hypothetical protein